MYEKPDEKGQSNITIKPGSIYCRNLSISKTRFIPFIGIKQRILTEY